MNELLIDVTKLEQVFHISTGLDRVLSESAIAAGPHESPTVTFAARPPPECLCSRILPRAMTRTVSKRSTNPCILHSTACITMRDTVDPARCGIHAR
jgi:hypothetical protein